MAKQSERKDLDQALVLLDLIGLMVRVSGHARNSACAALFAPFDPFWPESGPAQTSQTSITIPSRANSQTIDLAPESRLT
jgi:hypothetical protein